MAFVAFAILLPIAEIWTAIQVAHHIGGLATIALLLLISMSGPWLVRKAGLGVWRRARQRLDEGEMPGREAIDGVLLLIAGVLLSVPGFITGVFGILLLLPPVRTLVRVLSGGWLARRVRRSGLTVQAYSVGSHDPAGHVAPSHVSSGPGTVTAESHPVPPRRELGDTGGPPH